MRLLRISCSCSSGSILSMAGVGLLLLSVTADISKMYWVVELADEDRDLHRFVWRANKESPVQDYRMMRVTFVVASSPYLAVQALQQTAHDFGDQFPIMYTSFYVDDLLAWEEDSEAAIDFQTQLRQLLLRGGFDLSYWVGVEEKQDVINAGGKGWSNEK